jgi:hypothetical protein
MFLAVNAFCAFCALQRASAVENFFATPPPKREVSHELRFQACITEAQTHSAPEKIEKRAIGDFLRLSLPPW